MPAYSFADWQSGARPPDGWDCADAFADDWTREEVVSLMRTTAQPWKPPQAEPEPEPDRSSEPEAGTSEPPEWLNDVPCAVPEPQSFMPVEARREAAPHADSGPQALRQGQILGVERFDVEMEGWLRDQGWQVRRNLLSHEDELHTRSGRAPLTDERIAEARFALSYAANGRDAAKDKIVDALALIAERRAYHPVRDYLDGLSWDGVPRIDIWLIDYLGAPDTPLMRAFGRKILCAAVRRVREPGGKFDSMLILQGAQGVGKSSAVAALCPDPSWFTDQVEVGADAKTTIEKTSGAWIVEMPELDGMGRKDAARVKSFVTTRVDKARLSYARLAIERPRQFVLVGTTNESAYLSDTTGNRRFWIVPVGRADPAGIASVRDQLWAEAAHVEPEEPLWLDGDDLRLAQEAGAREASDYGPWHDLLAETIPAGPLKIEARDLWRLVGFDGPSAINRLTHQHRAHMRAAMTGMGFERPSGGLRNREGNKVKCYLRGKPDEANWWRPDASARYDL